jgi:hypothetical protein
MENREIAIEELQKGDEVITYGNGFIQYLRILRPLKLGKTNNWRGDTYYSRVMCSFVEPQARSWDRRGTLTGEGHNKEKYVDFNYRNIWLVKRENNN